VIALKWNPTVCVCVCVCLLVIRVFTLVKIFMDPGAIVFLELTIMLYCISHHP